MIDMNFTLQRTEFKLDIEGCFPGQGVTVVFGPSGCGKTTLLRAVAGLEPACRGRLAVNGAVWLDDSASRHLPAHARGVGFVFQQAGLFRHLSVQDNLQFGQRRRGTGSLNSDTVIATLELEPLLPRSVTDLSGGEQQRVALGRALLSNPGLLLLDEPLAALDTGSKNRLIPLIENALHLLDIPALYVTHSADELVRLADHVAIMERGRLVTDGPLVDVFSSIETPLAATDDTFSVLKGSVFTDHTVDRQLPGLCAVETDCGNLFHVSQVARANSQRVRLKIQARDISLALEKSEKTSILNILPATVEEVSEASGTGSCTVKLDLNGDKLLARISDYSRRQLDVQPGLQLFAQVKAVALLQGA